MGHYVCHGRQGVLVGDVPMAAALSALVQPKQSGPGSEPPLRRSSVASCSVSTNSSHEVPPHSVTAGCTANPQQVTDAASRPQTLTECQEFIRRLEADSVKQAHEVNCKNSTN